MRTIPKKLVTKLTGRILQREVWPLQRAFEKSLEPETEAIKARVMNEAFDIFSRWAAAKYPDADMDVLARYGCTMTVKGVNVSARNPDTKRWDKVYGFIFPEGKTVCVPLAGRWPDTSARVTYTGGMTGGPIIDDPVIAEFGPFIDMLRDKEHELRGRVEGFKEYLASRPLRREIGTHYPEIAREVWPFAMKHTAPKPQYYDCGICGSLHPATWNGDCRDDANRYASNELDQKHGAHGWDEVPMPTWDDVAENSVSHG